MGTITSAEIRAAGFFGLPRQSDEECSSCIKNKSPSLLNPGSKWRTDIKQILVTTHCQKVETIHKKKLCCCSPTHSLYFFLLFVCFLNRVQLIFLPGSCFPLKTTYRGKNFFFTKRNENSIPLAFSLWSVDWKSQYAPTFSRRAEGLWG